MEPTNNATEVLIAATIRAVIIAMATGLSAGTAAMAAGSDDRQAIIAGLGALASALIVRLAGEGLYDSERAKAGDVQVGDVGSTKATRAKRQA